MAALPEHGRPESLQKCILTQGGLLSLDLSGGTGQQPAQASSFWRPRPIVSKAVELNIRVSGNGHGNRYCYASVQAFVQRIPCNRHCGLR